VVVVLHMTQVFLYGGYKKPREATWMLGVVLLMLTLAYGLTGYLLPWDNRAYWGTVVTTQIATRVPLAGPYLTRLLGGQNAVGVVTFARFYGMHVLLLPPATALLIATHIYLVRKHGVAPAPGDEVQPKTKFYPRQAFKDTMAIFVAFMILFVMAAAVRVPLEQLADPTDATYIPRPEWYFLFLFQTLKFFDGPLEVVGTVVLPSLAVLALFLVPFIDRGKVMRVTRRTAAMGVVFLALLGWSGLTVAAVATTPKSPNAQIDYGMPTDWIALSPQELAGVGYFRQEHCVSCHPANGKPGIGPDLTNTSIRKTAAWMIEHFKHPSVMVPGSAMPPILLSDSQLNALAAFLLKLTPRNAQAIGNAPDFAVQGAMLFQTGNCGACHLANGVGMKIGPPLNGLARRRTKEWVSQHFANPQALSPGSIMPPYQFPGKEMDSIVDYLFTLPDSGS
jgi:ubiquinol-cytochrome c reductase cytochrome b subunit